MKASRRTVKLWDTVTSSCIATLVSGNIVQRLAFDTTCSSLYTNVGTFMLDNLLWSLSTLSATLPPSPTPQHVNRSGIGLSEDNEWVTWNSHKVLTLWLPRIYRPVNSDITAGTLAIGCASGRVLLLVFSPSHGLLI